MARQIAVSVASSLHSAPRLDPPTCCILIFNVRLRVARGRDNNKYASLCPPKVELRGPRPQVAMGGPSARELPKLLKESSIVPVVFLGLVITVTRLGKYVIRPIYCSL